MTKQEQIDLERRYSVKFDQTERLTEAIHRVAAAFERVADATEAQAKVADPGFEPKA